MAALTVGELAVQLEARTAEFRSAFTDADRRIAKFERNTNEATRRAGLSFRGLLGPIAAVGAALATIGAVRGLERLATSSIQTAAAFESYEIRLRTLLGTQDDANKALDNFLGLSTRTPFAVEQIVEGATTLASVALNDRESLEELTVVAANLAAITGLSFSEAAGNLQRALAAGIGAADLFRERGVRRLIESVQGVPDLTKVSLTELRSLFVATFGGLGKFGTAAEDLSFTLGGALSNIGDAFGRFRLAIGRALSPAVIATARGVIIPFFDSLTSKIDDSQTSLQGLFVEGFASAAESSAKLLEGLEPLETGLKDTFESAGDLAELMLSVFNKVLVLFKALSLGFDAVTAGLATMKAGVLLAANAFGFVKDQDVEGQLNGLYGTLTGLRTAAEDLGASLGVTGTDLPKKLEPGESALAGLAEKARAAAGEIRKTGAELIALQQARAAGAETGTGGGGGGGIPATPADREALKAALAERQARNAVATAEARFDALIERGFTPSDDKLEELSQVFAGSLTSGFADSFDAVLRGEAVDFAQAFADLGSSLFEAGMEDAFAQIERVAADLFQRLGEQFKGIFGAAGGEGISSALGAAFGIGAALIGNALRGTEARVSSSLAQSAVTSTEKVRGLVAGPTNIPIAEVGNALRDASAEQVGEIRRSNRLLEAILNALRAAPAATTDVAAAIADVVATEFRGTVALG